MDGHGPGGSGGGKLMRTPSSLMLSLTVRNCSSFQAIVAKKSQVAALHPHSSGPPYPLLVLASPRRCSSSSFSFSAMTATSSSSRRPADVPLLALRVRGVIPRRRLQQAAAGPPQQGEGPARPRRARERLSSTAMGTAMSGSSTRAAATTAIATPTSGPAGRATAWTRRPALTELRCRRVQVQRQARARQLPFLIS